MFFNRVATEFLFTRGVNLNGWPWRARPNVEELERRDRMNSAPAIGALLFDNPSPNSIDTLYVKVDDVDPDGDLLTFQYDWHVNGQLVQSRTSSSATAEAHTSYAATLADA